MPENCGANGARGHPYEGNVIADDVLPQLDVVA